MATTDKAAALAEVPSPPPADQTIHVLLGLILAELGPIGKNQENVEQKFMFRGYDDVVNELNPLFAKYGVFVVPDVVERVTDKRTTARGSTMYEVNLHVRFTFYGPLGDSVSASGWGEGTDMGDKATNKAMTGALKYVLFQSFLISTAEASDSDALSPEETYAGKGNGQSSPARGGSGSATHEAGFLIGDAITQLEAFVEAPQPWIAEAIVKFYEQVEKMPGKFSSLPEGVRSDVIVRLRKALETLHAASDFDPVADPAQTQELVRLAFNKAFPLKDGQQILGPDPFQPPIPFG